ncbi:MAG: hypothetical protein CM1200mP30_05990 [Pseudomonadota bacterium]|nr:MAG: hypothetical protein CM1200mP30_05990 [Pseudomonadota bacterium]
MQKKNYKAFSRKQLTAHSLTHGIVIKPVIVAGKAKIEDAKIGGITPAVFIFKGGVMTAPRTSGFPASFLRIVPEFSCMQFQQK